MGMRMTDPARSKPTDRLSGAIIVLAFVVQAGCAGIFLYDLTLDLFGLRVRPISWTLHELIEIGAICGLVLGLVMGVHVVRQTLGRAQRAEARLAEMSGAFHDLLEQRFAEWGLTPAERDVAMFIMKGCTIKEIAELRCTSPGTVKAQSAAIYRKAEVGSRAELLSLFIEDMMGPGNPVASVEP